MRKDKIAYLKKMCATESSNNELSMLEPGFYYEYPRYIHMKKIKSGGIYQEDIQSSEEAKEYIQEIISNRIKKIALLAVKDVSRNMKKFWECPNYKPKLTKIENATIRERALYDDIIDDINSFIKSVHIDEITVMKEYKTELEQEIQELQDKIGLKEEGN